MDKEIDTKKDFRLLQGILSSRYKAQEIKMERRQNLEKSKMEFKERISQSGRLYEQKVEQIMKNLSHNSGPPPSLLSLFKTADEKKHLRIPRLQVEGLDDKMDRRFGTSSRSVLPQFHRQERSSEYLKIERDINSMHLEQDDLEIFSYKGKS